MKANEHKKGCTKVQWMHSLFLNPFLLKKNKLFTGKCLYSQYINYTYMFVQDIFINNIIMIYIIAMIIKEIRKKKSTHIVFVHLELNVYCPHTLIKRRSHIQNIKKKCLYTCIIFLANKFKYYKL